MRHNQIKSQSEEVELIPGNLVFDPLNLYPENEVKQQKMQLAEIKHGRLAMLGVTSFVAQEWIGHVSGANKTLLLSHFYPLFFPFVLAPPAFVLVLKFLQPEIFLNIVIYQL